ncbi:MAG: hypothetical protein WA156_12815 [Methylocystis silviterrae]
MAATACAVAVLSGARVAVVVNIGFGDSVEPGLETIDYPAPLDPPAPRLRACAAETVIAEGDVLMVTRLDRLALFCPHAPRFRRSRISPHCPMPTCPSSWPIFNLAKASALARWSSPS